MAPDGTPDEITPRQRRVLVALLGGADPTAAAAQAGVSRRTVFRWQRDPLFRAALTTAARELFAAALDTLRAGAPAAAAELARLRRHAMTDAVKLRAAVAVFDVCHRANLEDLEQRVAVLEATARNDPGGVR